MKRGRFIPWVLLCAVLAMQCGPALSDEARTPAQVVVRVPAHADLIEKAIAPVRGAAVVNDEGDAWQLFRRLRPIIRDAVGTKGYFAPQISRVPPAEGVTGPQALLLKINVELGPQAVISELDIRFDGEINQPEFDARRERLKTLWLLGKGASFDQEEWTASKDNLLRDLLARDFAAATLSESEALVDPDTSTVALRVVYDSGPVFTFGALQIDGLKKHQPDLIERYNNIKPGDRYEQERLLALLSDLQNTSYFSSVDVKIDVDDRRPQSVPIQISVLESDSKRIGLGAGYSSNTGFRTEANYQFNNLFDRAYNLSTGLRLEQKRQSAYADVFFPPSRKGVLDSLGVAVDHQFVSDLEVDRRSLGAIREYTLGPSEFRLGVNFQLEDRRAQGVDFGGTQALVGSASWTRNQVDDRLNPRSGYISFGQIAAASAALASNQDFVRIYGKVQNFWTPARDHLLSTRFELGTVLANSQQDIPQDYLFRAGGSNSVRGFDFLDIGVLDQGVLVGGRRLMIGSLEYTRWLRGNLGAAVFTDIGDVANNWGDIDPRAAIGTGIRYKTPAGPIAFDIAKAMDEKRIRVHFALGVAF